MCGNEESGKVAPLKYTTKKRETHNISVHICDCDWDF